MKRTLNIDDLNPRQYEIFNEIINTPASKTKHFVLRASRQSGKTFLIIRLAIYLSFIKPYQSGGFVSASNRQFLKVFRAFKEIIPAELIGETKGGNSITFTNGSTLDFFTANSYDSVRGNSFDFLIGDEVAIWPAPALDAITPTLSAKKNAKAIFCSTPAGGGSFYDLCMAGNNLEDSFTKEFLMHYTDNPFYDLREVAAQKKKMSPFVFDQEYENQFIFGSGQVFGEFMQVQTDHYAPYNSTHNYYAGIDWSGAGEDSTILYIVNQFGETCLIYEAEEKNTMKQIQELLPILTKWKPLVYSEMNGIGTGPTDYLEIEEAKEGTFRLQKVNLTNELKGELVTGFLKDKNTEGTKMKLPDVTLCPKLDNQMAMYQASRTKTGKITYSHPKSGGIHDDYVDAMLYAFQALREDSPTKQYDMLGYVDAQDIDSRIAFTQRLAEDLRSAQNMDKETADIIECIW